MTSKYEEISTNIVTIVLDMIDITEKFNKMGTKEIDAMIVSSLNGSKRVNSTMKKILEMDMQISTLRQSITKANLLQMVSAKADTPETSVAPTPTPTVAEQSEKEVTPIVDTEDEPLHVRRKNIPKHVKTLVWGKIIGNDKPVAKCFSCRHETIDIRNFHCGHVIAESKGGTCTLDNLRPICAPCNGSMGTMSMNEFTSKYFGWTV
jgi:hypothetical protein